MSFWHDSFYLLPCSHYNRISHISQAANMWIFLCCHISPAIGLLSVSFFFFFCFLFYTLKRCVTAQTGFNTLLHIASISPGSLKREEYFKVKYYVHGEVKGKDNWVDTAADQDIKKRGMEGCVDDFSCFSFTVWTTERGSKWLCICTQNVTASLNWFFFFFFMNWRKM